jgi:hypothetical protein
VLNTFRFFLLFLRFLGRWLWFERSLFFNELLRSCVICLNVFNETGTRLSRIRITLEFDGHVISRLSINIICWLRDTFFDVRFLEIIHFIKIL